MASRLIAALRAAPVTLPCLAALALMVVWSTADAGYPLTHWAPGGLIVLALLAIAVLARPPRLREVPGPVLLALGCLAAYTALSFLSILWAAVPGDAWEGADRTLLYLLVFALFALWPQRGATATGLLSAWTLALACLALITLLHVDAAAGSPARLQALLPGGRLVYPAGYANADAAQWLIAFWPALLLARSRELPSALRGALAGGAVLLAGVALLSQSRGALYATPAMLVLVFALLPGRVRTFALLVPVAAAIGAAAPAVLRVGERLEAGHGATDAVHTATDAVHTATVALLAGALVVAAVVTSAAAIERRRTLPAASALRVHRGAGALAWVCLVVLLAGAWVAAGNPVTRARHAWDTFKSPSGYSADSGGSRLTSGLGSNRYDFYRVALDEFAAHPVAGIGADNFAEAYLVHGRSGETPHYPHSVELRTLSQTGLLGALLALAGLAGALLAGWRALARAPDPLARAAAAAALSGFAYWAVHGSFDWFWEFAGLGAPAFALLGLACALAPRNAREVASVPAAAGAAARSGRLAAAAPASGVEGAGAGTPAGGPAARGRAGGGVLAGGGAPPDLAGADARTSAAGPPARAHGRARERAAVLAPVLPLAAAAVVSLTAPWLSQLQVQSAGHLWVADPAAAYSRLRDAGDLNPLSDEPLLVAGTIALRRGELRRADREFAGALRRTPGDAYATLERGAIASARGQRLLALVLLRRAAVLSPRDPIARQALATAHRGRRIDVAALNRSILSNAEEFS